MRSFLPQPGLKPFGPKLGPRLLYPVWVKDGRQELVRGASFGERETRARCGDRVVASFLFDKLELELSPIKQEKLPEYPVPPLSQDWEARWFVLSRRQRDLPCVSTTPAIRSAAAICSFSRLLHPPVHPR
jgi:hypothetical protein